MVKEKAFPSPSSSTLSCVCLPPCRLRAGLTQKGGGVWWWRTEGRRGCGGGGCVCVDVLTPRAGLAKTNSSNVAVRTFCPPERGGVGGGRVGGGWSGYGEEGGTRQPAASTHGEADFRVRVGGGGGRGGWMWDEVGRFRGCGDGRWVVEGVCSHSTDTGV